MSKAKTAYLCNGCGAASPKWQPVGWGERYANPNANRDVGVSGSLPQPIVQSRWFEPGVCFAAGTLVHTKEGLKPIEQIKVGDYVLSKPENGGEQAYKRVVKTYAHPPQRVVEVLYDRPGQDRRAAIANSQPIEMASLIVTFNHPFWTKEEGWTPPSRMQGYDAGLFHFENIEGNSIGYAQIKNIYISDQPNVGWTSNRRTVVPDTEGFLWDYVNDKLIAADVWAIESVKYIWDSDNPDDLYFKLPVYNLEVEDFHTYYVGEHGIWVHNKNRDGLFFEVRNIVDDSAKVIFNPEHPNFWTRKEMENWLKPVGWGERYANPNAAQKCWDSPCSPQPIVQSRWFEQGACFAAGTLVHTKEGLKPIEQIKVGDYVLSKPENGGEQAYKRVVKTYAHPPERVVECLYDIPVNKPSTRGGNVARITVTLNHPFWTKEEGWTSPSYLQERGPGLFHFEDKDGDDISFYSIRDIYISDQENVGWFPLGWPATPTSPGTLWNYAEHRLVDQGVLALEFIREYEYALTDPVFKLMPEWRPVLDPDPFFKLPVYNLEVEDFHTYYVGEHGLWVHNTNCGARAVSVQVSTFYVPSPGLRPPSPASGRGNDIAVCKTSPLPLVGSCRRQLGPGERAAALASSLEKKCTRLNQNRSKQFVGWGERYANPNAAQRCWDSPLLPQPIGLKLRTQSNLSGEALQRKALDEMRLPALGCFIAGTLVHTKEGLKPIEQIKVGDWVLSRPENPEQGTETAYKRVTKTFKFEDKPVVRFWWTPNMEAEWAQSESVYVTPNHPVWFNPHGWVAVGYLHLPLKYRPPSIRRPYDGSEWTNQQLILADGSPGCMLDVFDLYRTHDPVIAFHEEDDSGVGGLVDFSGKEPVFADDCRYDDEKWGTPYKETRKRYTTTVYNIEVEDWHTYFVGKMGLWVHNTNCLEATLEVAPEVKNRRSHRAQAMARAVSDQVSTFYVPSPGLRPPSPASGRGNDIAVCKTSPLPLVGEGSGERAAASASSLEKKCTRLNQNRSKQFVGWGERYANPNAAQRCWDSPRLPQPIGLKLRTQSNLSGEALQRKALDEMRLPALGCFIAGTLVHTKEGLKPIEQIKVGDWVLSRPEKPEQGTETAYKRVTKTFKFEDKPVVRFWWTPNMEAEWAQSESVYVTPNHPVWFNPHGWVAVGYLHLPLKYRPPSIRRPYDGSEWTNQQLILADGSPGCMLDVFGLYRTHDPVIAFYEEDHSGVGCLVDFSGKEPVFADDCLYDYEKWGDPVNETRERYTTTVYNIEVEDWHTYFVGKMGLWVHNTNCLEATLEVAPEVKNRRSHRAQAMVRAVSAQVSTFLRTLSRPDLQTTISFPASGRGNDIAVCKISPLPLLGSCRRQLGSGERAAVSVSSLEKKCTRLNQNRSKQPEKLHGAKL